MRWIALILIATLASCSSGTGPSTLKMAIDALRKAGDEDERPKGKMTPPREVIAKRGQALVQINLNGTDVWPILQPVKITTGQSVLYTTPTRQSIYVQESLITGTRGLGTDLLGVETLGNDPLKRLTPPDNWPTRMSRSYRFAGEGPRGRVETYACQIKRGPDTVIKIAGTPFDVATFVETCGGTAGEFINAYAADMGTGRVWTSQQYIGADMPAMNMDILEPLTE